MLARGIEDGIFELLAAASGGRRKQRPGKSGRSEPTTGKKSRSGGAAKLPTAYSQRHAS